MICPPCSHDLAGTGTTAEPLALPDSRRPGQLATMRRAERDLACARLAAADGGPGPGPGPAESAGVRDG
jgi:hypothetical protein